MTPPYRRLFVKQLLTHDRALGVPVSPGLHGHPSTALIWFAAPMSCVAALRRETEFMRSARDFCFSAPLLAEAPRASTAMARVASVKRNRLSLLGVMSPP